MKTIHRLIISVITVLALVSGRNAFAATPAPLSPAAQAALNKGIIAAKVPDYLLAIRYFEEARKIAPQDPVIYLNMGLAESKIPGRELRALAWFGAYIAAYPDAPNAVAVKEQISVLEVKSQINTARFLKTVHEVTNQLSNSKKYFRSVPVLSFEKRDALSKMIILWAETGDIATALNSANLNEYEERPSNYYTIADIRAKSGDIDGAQKTAALIEDEYYKNRAKEAIVKAKSATGSTNAKPPTVSDWLSALGIIEYGTTRGIFSIYLNQAPFLDLSNHLLSLQASLPSKVAHENLQDEIYRHSEAHVYFSQIYEIAKTIVEEQTKIQHLLKQGARK